MKRIFLQLYRLAILVAIAWILRDHHIRLRIEGHTPITVEEVRSVLPVVADLRPDPGERAGMHLLDATGREVGYAVRTSPITDSIIGYRGWTDALVVLDPSLKVAGVKIRFSHDTRDHVGDVVGDPYFLKTWNGKPWADVARTSPEEAGIEGVSGATMTSMAVAEGITRRLAAADAALAIAPPPFRVRARDIGLAVVILAAIGLAVLGTHRRAWLRRGFQVLVILYIGFLNGDLLAQSLFVGWAEAGTPWRTAPGLVLLMAASLAVPWVSGKALYCQHLCPHGAAQELLHRVAPKRWRRALPRGLDAGLRWLPGLLLGFVITIAILILPIDLAHLEPFDAYVIKSAGVATIVIALVGLAASLFVPMAYCHYGCPTGALLNFIRLHGRADCFGSRDVAALLLVLFGAGLAWKYHAVHAWMVTY